jgi:hypothetical protein
MHFQQKNTSKIKNKTDLNIGYFMLMVFFFLANRKEGVKKERKK